MKAEQLDAKQLHEEWEIAVHETRRKPGLAARILFWSVGLLFPGGVDYRMLRVVELVARVPYNTWSQTGFVALTHRHSDPEMARVIQTSVDESRDQDDNEFWHLVILDELLAADGYRPTFWKEQVIPQLLAVAYWWLSFVLYVIRPKWSHALNADFEDHATACYAQYVVDHPEMETTQWLSRWRTEYDPEGHLAMQADLFRRIMADEIEHRDTSLEHIRTGARWSKP